MDNLSLFLFIFSMSNKNSLLDILMIFGAEYVIYIAFALIFVLAFKEGVRERKTLILASLSIPILIIIIKIIHLFLYQPRPFISHEILPLISYTRVDASFPSRHTALMFVLAFSYFFYKSKWRFYFLIAATWVGISRIYVGVHYPLDILGGVVTGVIAVWIAWIIKGKLKSRLSLN